MEQDYNKIYQVIGYLDGRIDELDGIDNSWGEIKCVAYKEILNYIKNKVL